MIKKYFKVTSLFLLFVLLGLFFIRAYGVKNQLYPLFLISPFEATDFNSNPGTVRLVDFSGKVYKTWHTKYQPLYSLFDKDGNLYVSEVTPYEASASGGGKTGLIEKFDKDGKVVWIYENELMHHDFFIDDNDDVFIITFKTLSPSYERRIVGGRPSEKKSISDTIVELDKNGKVVWNWSFDDHVKPEDFTLNPYTSREEFTHSNSVKYYETNPVNGKPCVLVSSRHLSTVFLIDKTTGVILWKSPKGMLSFQHDASLNVKDGTVMVFDNGDFRSQEKPLMYSRVVKIDPLSNKITWQFDGGKTGPQKAAFYSSFMGGAQEFSNGDVLVTYTTQGKVLLISPEKKIITQYVNTFLGSSQGVGFPNNALFKVQGYDSDFIYKKVLTGFRFFGFTL